ncbi:MAG: hypothetical protein B7Y80_19055 [Hyphomicrobium sp. 32-62-53]|nr:MAG: hypothetical protein B7Z29_19410 [Hyphomicrobium sp. 12-62-95]OYX97604.1 MAG: hypothetical protein B7Y80_19055 [Hyphomicrobium sp. 32-62-53]
MGAIIAVCVAAGGFAPHDIIFKHITVVASWLGDVATLAMLAMTRLVAFIILRIAIQIIADKRSDLNN